ncbi:hypothetical protein RB195_004590 [Necator americanus]|nr:globin [Necator americanus]ETN70124.1 globin [Necator americanus]
MVSPISLAAPLTVLFTHFSFAAAAALPFSDEEVKKHTLASLNIVPVDDNHHGHDFYTYFLTNYPENKKNFKGAENSTPEEIQKSKRFEKLGKAFLLSMHLLSTIYDNEPVFREYSRDLIRKHPNREVDPDTWKVFFNIWTNFLETKGHLTDEQKAAWEAIGRRFHEEFLAQLPK